MPRRKSDRESIKGKLGGDGGGSMDYRPPSLGRGLIKNSDAKEKLDDLKENLLRQLIVEIIKKCGNDWCLYTKNKDKRTGKRRRLGTHSSKSGAERQERAIKARGG